MEIPSGFLIDPRNPKKYNIIFNDSKTVQDISAQYNQYLKE
jgi:hypothetical protein